MVLTLRLLSALIIISGAALAIGGIPGSPFIAWPTTFVTPGVALMASGLAGLVGLQAAVNWRTQRAREIETSRHAHRESVYEVLLKHMTEVFTGGSQEPEALVRSRVAMWANQETLQALAGWHRKTGELMKEHGGVLVGQPTLKMELWDAYFDVVAAIRKDLSPEFDAEGITKEVILKMLFNDYPAQGAAQ